MKYNNAAKSIQTKLTYLVFPWLDILPRNFKSIATIVTMMSFLQSASIILEVYIW